jgi:hypothetical protein
MEGNCGEDREQCNVSGHLQAELYERLQRDREQTDHRATRSQ